MNQRLRKKSLALKANMKNKEPKSESESSSSDEDSGEFAMFTRRFRKFLKKEGKNLGNLHLLIEEVQKLILHH